MSNSVNKKTLSYGAIYLSLSTLFFVGSSYIANVFLGRWLGPEMYGLYGILLTTFTTINLIQTSGLPNATAKFISSDEKRENEILKSSLHLQIISTSIITIFYFFSAEIIANVLNDNSLAQYIRFSSLIFPVYGIFTLFTGYYNGRHLFRRQALVNISYSLTKLVSVIVLGYFFKLYGVLLGFVLSPLVGLIFGFKSPSKSAGHFPYKKLILFSFPLIGFTFFGTLQQTVDIFFVKAILKSNEAAGFYTASQSVSLIPFFTLSAFSMVLFPSISKGIAANDMRRVKSLISNSLRLVLLVLVPAVLLIHITSNQIIEFLYSETYLPASKPLSVLVIGIGFLTGYTILANIMNGAGMPKVSLVLSIVGTLTVVILCLLLVPSQGLMGAAMSTAISAVIVFLCMAIAVWRRFGVLISLKSLMNISIASIILFISATFTNSVNGIFAINYFISIGIYLISLILMKEITSRELELLPWRITRD